MCSLLSKKENNNYSSAHLICKPRDGQFFEKIAGYVGTLSDRRVDFDLLFYLTDNLPEVLFLIVGLSDGVQSTEEKISMLKNKDNVHFIEGMKYDDLPEIISQFDLGLIPYKNRA